MRRALQVLLGCVALSCASDRGDDRGPPVHGARGGSSGSSGSGGTGASGGEDNAGGEPSAPGGSAGDASDTAGGEAGRGVAGTPSDAGAGGSESPGTDPPPVDELCPRAPSLGGAEKLSLSTDADERFGGITPDELVIAWTVTLDETVTLYVASREDAGAAFGEPVSVVIEAALEDKVALSPDGLRVAFVNPDRKGFSVMARPSLDDAFGLSMAGEFALLDATGGGLPAGAFYADPVLAGDGISFYYSQYGDDTDATLRLSNRLAETDPWPAGGPLPSRGLSAAGGDRFAPTGASRDGRALFLWDTAAQTEVLAFVGDDSFEFEPVFELGPLNGAAPNGACTRLYYSAPDPSLDVFVVSVAE